jgi:hypothetical protein
MAVLTASVVNSGQGVIQVFKFTSIADGDTFAGPAGPKAFWLSMIGNPATQTSAGSSVTESAGTYTFYPGENSQAGTLFVIL